MRMLRLAGKALAFGLVGVVATPIVVFFGVLIAAHLLDPRCGTPGDSGGCEMGAASIAFLSALPGLAGGIVLALIQGLRKRAG
jgi:membrane associated rhomboid family serine protease